MACGQADNGDQQEMEKTVPEEESPNLEGTWEMTYYYMYENDEIVDTVVMNEGFRQVKMYDDGHVMWSRQVPTDSAQLFGYGTYMIDGNSFSENLEYGSHYMMGIMDSMRIFNWVLDISRSEYTQTEVNDNGQRIYAEHYTRIE